MKNIQAIFKSRSLIVLNKDFCVTYEMDPQNIILIKNSRDPK